MTTRTEKRVRKHLQAIGGVRVTTSLADMQRYQTELVRLKKENHDLNSDVIHWKEYANRAEKCSESWRNTSSKWEAVYKKCCEKLDQERNRKCTPNI